MMQGVAGDRTAVAAGRLGRLAFFLAPVAKVILMAQLGSRRVRAAVLTALVGYWTALFLGTHWPVVPAVVSQNGDKLLHFAAYAGLGFLLTLALGLGRRLTPVHYLLIPLGLSAFGAFDEITQIPVGRHADVGDWVADTVGAATGIAVAAGALVLWRRRALGHPARFGVSPDRAKAQRAAAGVGTDVVGGD